MLKIKLSIVALACDTPEAAGAVDAHVVPFDVNTLPEEPGATTCNADVPLPKMTLLAVRVVAPVPPLPTGRVPVTPVVSGRPVALVNVAETGTPSAEELPEASRLTDFPDG